MVGSWPLWALCRPWTAALGTDARAPTAGTPLIASAAAATAAVATPTRRDGDFLGFLWFLGYFRRITDLPVSHAAQALGCIRPRNVALSVIPPTESRQWIAHIRTSAQVFSRTDSAAKLRGTRTGPAPAPAALPWCE
ncbi:hypothetical protein GCM10009872_35780 [Actinopolymorpha rutila]